MGEEFEASGYQGESVPNPNPGQGLGASTAFDRLQYVCHALHVLKLEGGSFPYDFRFDPDDVLPGQCSNPHPNVWCNPYVLSLSVNGDQGLFSESCQDH